MVYPFPKKWVGLHQWLVEEGKGQQRQMWRQRLRQGKYWPEMKELASSVRQEQPGMALVSPWGGLWASWCGPCSWLHGF